MTNTIYIHQPEKPVSFTRLPNFFFEAPTIMPMKDSGILNVTAMKNGGMVEVETARK